MPLSKVISDATGKRALAIDPKNEADQQVIKVISDVLDEVMKRMNAPDSPVQNIARINEAAVTSKISCANCSTGRPDSVVTSRGPLTNRGQRSGYPDLRLVEPAANRVFYLDPKLYSAGSRESTFRTVYFEPKITTNKVHDDAVHLLVRFEHTPKTAGHWNFTRWDLVDLADFKVRLKAEFQGSNRDIYRPEAIIATSAK